MILASPNLPENKVSCVVVSPQYPQIINALEKYGIEVLNVNESPDVHFPIRCHADMLFAYLGNGKFAVEKNQLILRQKLLNMGFVCIDSGFSLKEQYPFDISLNFCVLGDKIICNSENTADIFKVDKIVVDVKQGYAKCSCLPVNENSIITDDVSIYKSLLSNDIDVLLVSKGSVKLPGYDFGFIGGCAGKIAKDTVCFCGDIKKHSDYIQIVSFMKERNVYPLSLSGDELLDVGSVIPIIEC